MTVVDPEVAACRRRHRRHRRVQVERCAGCGICAYCDVTLGQQETPDEDLCENCAVKADAERLERLLTWGRSGIVRVPRQGGAR